MKSKPRARPSRIDWFRVITNLERCGFTVRDIAFQVNMSRGWVEHLKNSPGAEPRFDDGNVLLDLWCDAMDKPLADVPREGLSVYA